MDQHNSIKQLGFFPSLYGLYMRFVDSTINSSVMLDGSLELMNCEIVLMLIYK